MATKKTVSKMSNKDFLLMIIPVILALIIVSFTVGLYVSQKISEGGKRTDVEQQSGGVEDTVGAGGETAMEPEPGSIIDVPGELSVAWLAKPEVMDPSNAFRSAVDAYREEMYSGASWKESTDGVVGAYRIGTVQGATYKGYALTLQIVKDSYEIGGPFYTYYYVLIPSDIRDRSVVLGKYYSYSSGDFGGGRLGYSYATAQQFGGGKIDTTLEALLSRSFSVDYGTKIPDLEYKEVTLSSGAVLAPIAVGEFTQATYDEKTWKYGVAPDVVVGTTQGRSVYRRLAEGAAQELFYTIGPDGRAVWYDAKLPFWSVRPNEAQKITISLPGGSSFSGDYIKGVEGGCGFISFANVTSTPNESGKVKLLGGAGGTDFYELTDLGLADHRNDAEAWLGWNEGKTVEDYIALKPFLYVQDAFGRWLELKNTQVLYPAECGKPVIYLYPEEKTDAVVEVAPVGGFSKVEPAYNNGWRVTASPDGVLVNKDDGKTYPYLFWEGDGGLYREPEQYWVMKREEVGKALPKILWNLGLNTKEIYDFMEFWGPRMQEYPYYKIGFHGNKVMDQLAPLKVTPKQQSTLRLLMDYQGLQEPIAENPPKLPPRFKRAGFTVVEWGGVLRGE